MFLTLACCSAVYGLLPKHDCYMIGDVNGDGAVNVSDSSFLTNYLFLGGPQPGCLAACDVNGDDVVNISDAIIILQVLFQGRQPPPGWGICETHESPLPCGARCCEG